MCNIGIYFTHFSNLADYFTFCQNKMWSNTKNMNIIKLSTCWCSRFFFLLHTLLALGIFSQLLLFWSFHFSNRHWKIGAKDSINFFLTIFSHYDLILHRKMHKRCSSFEWNHFYMYVICSYFEAYPLGDAESDSE